MDDNPYETPGEEIIRAELVKPKRSVGFRVLRAIVIALAIFMGAQAAFYCWVQSVISSRP